MTWILIVYAVGMVICGLTFYRRNKSSGDFLLAGRKASLLSALMSVGLAFIGGITVFTLPALMSGKNGLLRGLLALIFICAATVLQWIVVSRKLRVYSELSSDSLTFPTYLENRFNEKTGVLRAVTASVIMVVFLLLAASMFSLCAGVLSEWFGLDYIASVLLIAGFTGIYLFLGGVSAGMKFDALRLAFVSLVSAVVVVLVIYSSVRNGEIFKYDLGSLQISEISGVDAGVFDFIPAVGLGAAIFFMPFSAMILCSVKQRRNPRRKGFLSLAVVTPFLLGFVVCGALGYIGNVAADIPERMYLAVADSVYVDLQKMFVVFVYICVIMSLADAALIIATSAFSFDLYPRLIHRSATDKNGHLISSITVFFLALVATLFAFNSDLCLIIRPVDVWSIIVASFGPSLVFPLYMKKITWVSSLLSVLAGLVSSVILSMWNAVNGVLFLPMLIALAISTVVFFVSYAVLPKRPAAISVDEYGRVNEIMHLHD